MVHSGRSDALGSLFFVVGDFLLLFFLGGGVLFYLLKRNFYDLFFFAVTLPSVVNVNIRAGGGVRGAHATP